MKRATIKDIAKVLEVNTSTVSRALNNHPDISQPMKVKVQEVAKALNYTPNLLALNLKTNKTKTIGLIVSSVGKFFVPSFINGVGSVLESHGYKLVILASDESFDKEADHVRLCCNSQMDGIILSLTNQTIGIDHLDLVIENAIPLVIFDKTIKQNKFSSITINDAQYAEMCTEFLLNNNCTNILGVFGNPNMTITKERLIGFNKAVEKNTSINAHSIFASDIEEALQKTIIKLNEDASITGIYCMSDEVLTGATAALHQLNKLNDIKLVCISDGVLTPYHVPAINYVQHDGFAMGVATANQLIIEINSKEKITPIALKMECGWV
jgi:LacI family transcriptional regulator